METICYGMAEWRNWNSVSNPAFRSRQQHTTNQERTNRMIKSFNSSIGRLCLTKTKSLIQASLIAGTVLALLSSAGEALGQAAVPSTPFEVLLQGIFQPAVHFPDLGLSQVDLGDRTYSTVPIYAVSGIPGTKKDKAVGDFYVQIGGDFCAYHVPGGSFSAMFVGSNTVVTSDGEGGIYITGTYELDILEGTGTYRSFAGGHIHMVDILRLTAAGVFDEVGCHCHVSRWKRLAPIAINNPHLGQRAGKTLYLGMTELEFRLHPGLSQ
jgi:hypothetical protein